MRAKLKCQYQWWQQYFNSIPESPIRMYTDTHFEISRVQCYLSWRWLINFRRSVSSPLLLFILKQVILCTKEVAVKARSSAFSLLIECCNSSFRSTDKTRPGLLVRFLAAFFCCCFLFCLFVSFFSGFVCFFCFFFYHLWHPLFSFWSFFCRMFDVIPGVGDCWYRGLTAHDQCNNNICIKSGVWI